MQSIPGIEAVYNNQQGCKEFELPNDRMGDLILVSGINTVIGTSAERHDMSGLEVPLRSHGGISEQRVPFIISQPVSGLDSDHPLRNFDIFKVALNHTSQD